MRTCDCHRPETTTSTRVPPPTGQRSAVGGRRLLTVAVVVIAFVVGACGGGGNDGDGSDDPESSAATAATAVATDASAPSDGTAGSDAGGDAVADQDAGPAETDDGPPSIELNSGTGSTANDVPLPAASEEPTTVGSDGVVQGQGVSDTTISLGFVLDESHADTDAFVMAQRAYWTMVNDAGGVAGRTVALTVANSSGSASAHLQAVADFAAGDNAALMIGGIDSLAGTEAVVGDLVSANLVAVPLSAWSGWTDPDRGANLLEVLISDCAQAISSMSYLGDRGGDRVAIVSSPGQPFTDAVAGARVALSHDELELVVNAIDDLSSPDDFGAIVEDLSATVPDAVWLATDAHLAAEFMQAARDAGFRGKFGGIPQSFDPHLVEEFGETLDGYLMGVGHAMWADNAESGMQKMMAALDEENPFATVDATHIRSWVVAMTTHQAMERAAEENTMTRRAIVEATQTLKADFEALAPNQQWTTNRDTVPLGTYLYEADLAFDPGASVGDEDASSGYSLRKGPFISDAALAWTPETCTSP